MGASSNSGGYDSIANNEASLGDIGRQAAGEAANASLQFGNYALNDLNANAYQALGVQQLDSQLGVNSLEQFGYSALANNNLNTNNAINALNTADQNAINQMSNLYGQATANLAPYQSAGLAALDQNAALLGLNVNPSAQAALATTQANKPQAPVAPNNLNGSMSVPQSLLSQLTSNGNGGYTINGLQASNPTLENQLAGDLNIAPFAGQAPQMNQVQPWQVQQYIQENTIPIRGESATSWTPLNAAVGGGPQIYAYEGIGSNPYSGANNLVPDPTATNPNNEQIVNGGTGGWSGTFSSSQGGFQNVGSIVDAVTNMFQQQENPNFSQLQQAFGGQQSQYDFQVQQGLNQYLTNQNQFQNATNTYNTNLAAYNNQTLPQWQQALASAQANANAPVNTSPQSELAALQGTPGYQFASQQGQQSITNQMASQGFGPNSPNTQAALVNYANQLAQSTYQQQVQASTNTAGLGATAANNTAALTGQLGSLTGAATLGTGTQTAQGYQNLSALNSSIYGNVLGLGSSQQYGQLGQSQSNTYNNLGQNLAQTQTGIGNNISNSYLAAAQAEMSAYSAANQIRLQGLQASQQASEFNSSAGLGILGSALGALGNLGSLGGAA